jgi:hypothetical protein
MWEAAGDAPVRWLATEPQNRTSGLPMGSAPSPTVVERTFVDNGNKSKLDLTAPNERKIVFAGASNIPRLCSRAKPHECRGTAGARMDQTMRALVFTTPTQAMCSPNAPFSRLEMLTAEGP